ncbi:MAG: hypothetical protein JRH20_05330, partial [Deltaproteobacteria bacterium]|nr:hypothetical protein [Deltaproteobacteria bacterium]
MPTFTCRKCKHALSVERMPHSCPRCYSPAAEAYEGSQRSGVHRLFDTGEYAPQGRQDDEAWAADVGKSPDEQEVHAKRPPKRKKASDTSELWPPAPGLADVPTDPYALRGGLLKGLDRDELRESDIEDAQGVGLDRSRTLEIDEDDLELAANRELGRRGGPPALPSRTKGDDGAPDEARERLGTLPFGVAFSPESGPPLGAPREDVPPSPSSRVAPTGPQLPDGTHGHHRRQFPTTQPMPPVADVPQRPRRAAPTRRQRRLPTSQNERLMESVKKDQRRRWSGLLWAAMGALVAFAVFRVMGVNESNKVVKPSAGPVFPTAKPVNPLTRVRVVHPAMPDAALVVVILVDAAAGPDAGRAEVGQAEDAGAGQAEDAGAGQAEDAGAGQAEDAG